MSEPKNVQKTLPTGSIVALVTPYDESGKVNYKKIKRLVEWHKSQGTSGIVVFGTTGESCCLSTAEKEKILATCLEQADGDIFVFAGSGNVDTFKAVDLSRRFCQLGADGLLVVSPYYLKTNDDGMLKHFLAVAESATKPVVPYNVPSRTGCEISLSVLTKLKKHENVRGLKEASGNFNYLTNVVKLADENFIIYCGCDEFILPYFALGARGVISVWANATPAVVAQLADACLQNRMAEARKMQLDYLDFVKGLFVEPNPIPIKGVMNYLGWQVGAPRLPLGELSKKNLNFLARELAKQGEQKCEKHKK